MPFSYIEDVSIARARPAPALRGHVDEVGDGAGARRVDRLDPVDVPHTRRDVGVRVGGGGALCVRHVQQQGVLLQGGPPAQDLVANDAVVAGGFPAQDYGEPWRLTSMATGPWCRWRGAWGSPADTTNGWRGCDEDERQSANAKEEFMNGNIWDLKSGDRITLDSEVTAEVVAPTEDGEWIRVKYMDAPESPEIIGTEDLCSTDEIVSYTA